jgi:hypothetical protein
MGAVVQVTGRAGSLAVLTGARLTSGRYRLRCYFASDAGGADGPPFTVEVPLGGPQGRSCEAVLTATRPLVHAHEAEYEIEIEPGRLAREIHLLATGAGHFGVLGARIDRLARVVSRSVLDLPSEQPVWLYGAGQGGRQAKHKLELAGLRVSGFIDKFKTGTLDGLPILDLEAARGRMGRETTLIIASMFWEEIRADIETAGVEASLYSFYPFTGDVVYALN